MRSVDADAAGSLPWSAVSLRRAPARGRGSNVAVAVLASATFAAGAAPETSYRLAGIIGAGPERLVAVIELPDGRQRLFRAGDVLGNGQVREITSTHARIELAGRELLLGLRGNPRLVAEARVEPMPGDDDVDSAEENSRRQQLSFTDAVRLLGSLQRAGSSQAVAATAAADALREEINHVLEMPAGARVVAVDEFSVDTPEEALEALITRLSEGGQTRVAVSGAGVLETVWLAPIDEQ